MRRSGGTTEEAWDGRWTRGAIALLLALVLACGSDGNGPMEPGNGNGNGFSVSGTYLVTSTVLENTCDFDWPMMGVVEIVQQGNQITFILEDFGEFMGSFNTVTGEFTIEVSISDPIVGSLEISETGQFTSNTAYMSEFVLILELPGEEPCTVRTNDSGVRQ